jgi:hypothetical protein
VVKAEQTSSVVDTFKLMTAVLVLIAGVVGFYYFEEESQLLRVLGMLAVGVVALFIAAIRVFRVEMLPTMIGYIGTYFMYWLALGMKYPWPTDKS